MAKRNCVVAILSLGELARRNCCKACQVFVVDRRRVCGSGVDDEGEGAAASEVCGRAAGERASGGCRDFPSLFEDEGK